MLTCISNAQARTKCVSAFCASSGLRHFTREFLYVLTCMQARTKCVCVCPRSGLVLVCGILPVNFCVKLLFCNVDMHFDCAGSHKVCA